MDPLCHRDHAAHEPSWTLAAVQRPGQQLQQQQQLQMCVACVLETLGDHNISVCRKTLALSRLLERLLQDGGGPLVSLLAAGNLAAAWSLVHNLTGMLTVLQDVPALNLVMEVLTQLTCRLKSEDVARALLAMVEKQVTGPAGPKQSLPFIALLGKLIDALPPLAERLAHHQAPLLEQLVALLRYPDEAVQVAAFYACRGACGGGTGGVTLEERFPARLLRTMCAATLATLGGAPGTELQFNALGLLRQLLRVAPLVSELMRPLPDLAREPSLTHAANAAALRGGHPSRGERAVHVLRARPAARVVRRHVPARGPARVPIRGAVVHKRAARVVHLLLPHSLHPARALLLQVPERLRDRTRPAEPAVPAQARERGGPEAGLLPSRRDAAEAAGEHQDLPELEHVLPVPVGGTRRHHGRRQGRVLRGRLRPHLLPQELPLGGTSALHGAEGADECPPADAAGDLSSFEPPHVRRTQHALRGRDKAVRTGAVHYPRAAGLLQRMQAGGEVLLGASAAGEPVCGAGRARRPRLREGAGVGAGRRLRLHVHPRRHEDV